MFQFVYVLINGLGKTYIGCTGDLKQRFKQHNNGDVKATKSGRPWKLKAYFAIDDEYRAFFLEKYFKTGSGKAFLNKHILNNQK